MPEPLKKAVEREALEENTTFQEIINRAIHDMISNEAKRKSEKIMFKTHDLGVPLDNLTRADFYPVPDIES
jgi:hypothetical protein